MARPSKNTDQLLIDAAQELLPQTGCSGLNLRQVAKRAGVNLGMFHYHFGSKERFLRAVLQRTYEDFLKELNLAVEAREADPGRALEAALRTFSEFVRGNRQLIVALVRDVLNGDRLVLAFVRENIGRHVSVIVNILRRVEKDLELAPLPALVFLLASVNVPILVTELVKKNSGKKSLGMNVEQWADLIASDEAIAQRIDLALGAVLGRGGA